MIELCAVFGLYPSYVAGILKRVVEINFYVLCNDELTYSEYTGKAISSELCTICVSCEKDHFTLSSGEETVLLKYETKMMEDKLPSVDIHV
jgi:AraC-like DNA-binding protein